MSRKFLSRKQGGTSQGFPLRPLSDTIKRNQSLTGDGILTFMANKTALSDAILHMSIDFISNDYPAIDELQSKSNSNKLDVWCISLVTCGGCDAGAYPGYVKRGGEIQGGPGG